jgi:DNA polymerase III epsilon subunit-like protein
MDDGEAPEEMSSAFALGAVDGADENGDGASGGAAALPLAGGAADASGAPAQPNEPLDREARRKLKKARKQIARGGTASTATLAALPPAARAHVLATAPPPALDLAPRRLWNADANVVLHAAEVQALALALLG